MSLREGITLAAPCGLAVVLALAVASPGAGNPQETLTEARRTDRLRAVEQMPKIDAHAHVMAMAPEQRELFAAFLARHNFQWLDICTSGLKWERLQSKMEQARLLRRQYPGRVSWAPSFNLSNWGKSTWLDEALATVSAAFSEGAVAVKVWKEIGMVLRDPGGRYVMIDDPRFTPVLEYIERSNRTLVAHIGEPRNCWLPLAEMTTESDRRYFGSHPEYHGHLHPEVPGYKEQIAARDRVLELHPRLRVVGCHLGSLEYDVDEIARRLDSHRNFAVDLAARLVHLQIQPRDRVRAFLVKYQDRVIYATDLEFGSDSGESPADPEQVFARFAQTYRADMTWLATDATVDVPRASPTAKSQGLALPLPVLRKIYRDNARKWYGM